MRSDKEEHTMDVHDTKILVAEDDESNRNQVAHLLEQAQYEVHLAADGHEALEFMFRGVVDVVVTDWHMPRLSGTDFLSLSRILWPDIPVIVVSAYAAPSLEGIPRGAFAWLIKPYKREELLQVLRMAVQTTAHRHQEQSATTAVLP
ncbi:MAG TPA: response regulator [Nitrospiraceae bacterium]|nr:response regulator [Nitrospiraceae bacterium]